MADYRRSRRRSRSRGGAECTPDELAAGMMTDANGECVSPAPLNQGGRRRSRRRRNGGSKLYGGSRRRSRRRRSPFGIGNEMSAPAMGGRRRSRRGGSRRSRRSRRSGGQCRVGGRRRSRRHH